MDRPTFSIEQMKLRAFVLSGRTVRLGRTSAERRLDRLQRRSFMIAQCAATAALAWLLARQVPGHTLPAFAPVAAILTLGLSFGARARRGVEVAIGVAVGVGVGDLWVWLFGTGVWQIAIVCALAMALATLLGAGPLMATQAAVQSIFVIASVTGVAYGVSRWLDALIGCAVALLVATLAPSTPLRRPGELAARILTEMADTLTAAVVALRACDSQAADAVLDRARAAEQSLAALAQAASEGLAVVRHSPFRRRQLGAVTALADLHEPLDHASRNLRVLARRSATAIWRGQQVPPDYLDVMEGLAEVCRFMAIELENHRLPAAAKERLRAVAVRSAHAQLSGSISAVVILAQARSMIVDMLELTGMDYADARALVPDLD